MAGSIALSLTQRYDNIEHLPLSGGQLQFYAAGTTTPQSAYQDVGLTIPWPNPLTLDAGGNVPQLFFADGYIKFRLSNADGLVQLAADYVLVLGPTSGGGAAPSVDATTILSTGDLKWRYGVGTLTGFVRLNARTIGSATSGASERANSDTQALFEYLWNTDANLAVSTGRGASSTADWTANKTIALPDFRGRTIAGLDDMGNSAAGRLSSSYFGGVSGASGTALGGVGGDEKQAITISQLPVFTPAVASTVQPQFNAYQASIQGTFFADSGGGGIVAQSITNSQVNAPQTRAFSVTMESIGGGGAHVNVQPTMLATFYCKL